MLRFQSGKTIPGCAARLNLTALDIRDGLSPDADQLTQLQLCHTSAMPQFLEASCAFRFVNHCIATIVTPILPQVKREEPNRRFSPMTSAEIVYGATRLSCVAARRTVKAMVVNGPTFGR